MLNVKMIEIKIKYFKYFNIFAFALLCLYNFLMDSLWTLLSVIFLLAV
jgi:hypothetical protein